jgi:uncharacterized protein (DUF427 family)/acyl-CoA thioesterase
MVDPGELVESGWDRYPDHVIDVVPFRHRVRVWAGDQVIAESDACLLLEEAKHVDRLYFPVGDVDFDLLEETEHHTVCPFKGRADYWSIGEGDQREENVVWGYRAPFPEVGPIEGHVAFYHERVRVEIDEQWPGADGTAQTLSRFPAWGDELDLVRLVDVQDAGEPGHFVAAPYRNRQHAVYGMNEERVDQTHRDVVEGGQLLGQAIVAATRTMPEQRVVNAHIVFSKAASWEQPLDVSVDVLRPGRTFSTVSVRFDQDGQFRSAALLLLDRGAPDAFGVRAEMPEVPGPEDADPVQMSVTGRQLRAVGNAYVADPDDIGAPEISIWCRFRDEPGEECLRQALMAQSTTHWMGAAAMRPIPGVGLAGAHIAFSGGPLAVSMTFHDEAEVTDWLLYTNVATYADRGLTYGEGRIFASDGRLVGSFSVPGMMRGFTAEVQGRAVAPGRLM